MTSGYPEIVYLNGKYLRHDEAKISVFDRGFIFGDGIYEGIAKMNGRLFCFEEHIARMESGLSFVGIPFDTSDLHEIIMQLEKRQDLENQDAFIYIQITRGTAPRKHAFPDQIEPSCFVYMKVAEYPDEMAAVQVITRPDNRWHRCDIKMTSLLGNVMASQAAKLESVRECLLIRDGLITEGSHTNVFFVKNQTVFTHPADSHILHGITRKVVIDLCRKYGISLVEKAVSVEDLRDMDEAFLTGTSSQITPICQIDDIEIPLIEKGISQQLIHHWNQLKKT